MWTDGEIITIEVEERFVAKTARRFLAVRFGKE